MICIQFKVKYNIIIMIDFSILYIFKGMKLIEAVTEYILMHAWQKHTSMLYS